MTAGLRKMTAGLRRKSFAEVSKHTVDRLTREGMNGLVCGRRITTTFRAKNKIGAKDLLNRAFSTDAPDKV